MISAPSACLLSLTPVISCCTSRSRATGSATSTGSGATSCVSRLPSEPWSSSERIETGTAARSSVPSVLSPRPCIQCAQRARGRRRGSTSLTVPPKAFLTVLKSSSFVGTNATRRCEPISTLSGERRRRAQHRHQRLAEAAQARAVGDRRERLGGQRRDLARVAGDGDRGELGRRGLGLRDPRRAARRRAAGRGARSNSAVAMSMPLTPSTTEWWVLEMIAKRPPESPSTSSSSHSGFVRSRRSE